MTTREHINEGNKLPKAPVDLERAKKGNAPYYCMECFVRAEEVGGNLGSLARVPYCSACDAYHCPLCGNNFSPEAGNYKAPQNDREPHPGATKVEPEKPRSKVVERSWDPPDEEKKALCKRFRDEGNANFYCLSCSQTNNKYCKECDAFHCPECGNNFSIEAGLRAAPQDDRLPHGAKLAGDNGEGLLAWSGGKL